MNKYIDMLPKGTFYDLFYAFIIAHAYCWIAGINKSPSFFIAFFSIWFAIELLDVLKDIAKSLKGTTIIKVDKLKIEQITEN